MAAFTRDTFTGTDSTSLASHTGEVGASWTASTGFLSSAASITNNAVHAASVDQHFHASGTPSVASMAVCGRFKILSALSQDYGIKLCEQVGAQQWYSFTLRNVTSVRFFKNSSAPFATSIPTTLTIGETYDLSSKAVVGGSAVDMTFWLQRLSDGFWMATDGSWQAEKVACKTATDSSSPLLGVGRAGLFLSTSDGSTTGMVCERFLATPVDPDGVTIDADDEAIFYTPGNWKVGETAETVNCGAYLKAKFSGTSLRMPVDVWKLLEAGVTGSDYPKVIYEVDGEVQDAIQLTAADTLLTLATGLDAGTHSLKLFLGGVASNSEDRWATPVMSLVVGGFLLDVGATISAPTLRSNRILAFTDSHGEGREVGGVGDTVANQNPRLAYPQLLGDRFNAEVSCVAFSYQGYSVGNSGAGVPDLVDAWDFLWSGESRLSGGLFTAEFLAVFCMVGQNDASADVTADVTALAEAWRTAAPDSPLFFCLPPNGSQAADIDAGVTAAADANAFYLDVGEIVLLPGPNKSGSHLSEAGHEVYAGLVGDVALELYPGLVPVVRYLGVPCGLHARAVS